MNSYTIINYTEACRSTLHNLQLGVNSLRLIQDPTTGRPTDVVTTNQMKFNGEGNQVDTGVVIDGSTSDFTMMMAFTLESGEYYIANSGQGDNRIFAYHTGDNYDLQVGIGKFSQVVTFDPANPIHAMIARFNTATKELEVAIDGGALQSMGAIEFDGPTGKVYIGSSPDGSLPFDGFVGEGILSATIESDSAWQTFWNKVKDEVYCEADGPGEQFVNTDFDCGLLGWYPNHNDTQLTDNGDGTVTVQNIGSWAYASLMPGNVYLEPGDYVLTMKVTSITGSGKVSYRVGNNWTDIMHHTDTGLFQVPFTLTKKTDNWSIGASGDENAVITYDSVSIKPLVQPDWWDIDTLDENDIIAAYDFGWVGHADKTSAYTDFVHGLIASDETGSASWNRGVGLIFDGESISFPVPDGLSDMEISTIIQIANASKRGALDAYFGWFSNDGSRYILQQDFDADVFRWSSGQDSDPVEAGPSQTDGIAGTSGEEFYAGGTYLGSSTNGIAVDTSSQKMYVGGAMINGSVQQYAKFTAVKVLVVKRKLTATEHKQIASRMQ